MVLAHHRLRRCIKPIATSIRDDSLPRDQIGHEINLNRILISSHIYVTDNHTYIILDTAYTSIIDDGSWHSRCDMPAQVKMRRVDAPGLARTVLKLEIGERCFHLITRADTTEVRGLGHEAGAGSRWATAGQLTSVGKQSLDTLLSKLLIHWISNRVAFLA